MESKVLELISEHFGIPIAEVNPTMELRHDLVATDLEIADFFQAVENAFTITIPAKDAASIQTVEDLINYVTDHSEELS